MRAGTKLSRELLDERGILRLVGDVLVLLRIGFVVVEFPRHKGAFLVAPLDVAVAVGAHRDAPVAAFGVFAESRRLVPRCVRIVEQPRESYGISCFFVSLTLSLALAAPDRERIPFGEVGAGAEFGLVGMFPEFGEQRGVE